MPTYAYKCASCSHELEAFQNISDPPLAECTNCGKQTLERGIGGGYLMISSSNKNASGQPGSSCCPCGKSKCGS